MGSAGDCLKTASDNAIPAISGKYPANQNFFG
jgi:hypothetical protein